MNIVIKDLYESKLFPYTVTALSNSKCDDIGRINPEKYHISKKEHTNTFQLIENAENFEVREFYDTLNVACRYKPLAMTIRNIKWWRNFKSNNIVGAQLLIDRRNTAEVIAYKHGVRCIHHKVSKGYDTFYYHEKDGLKNVLKLIAFVINHNKISHFTTPEYHYIIGKLLGYSIKNIEYFLYSRYDFILNYEFVLNTNIQLENLNINLYDFDKKKIFCLDKPYKIKRKNKFINNMFNYLKI